jgi:putative drug exporter of the RND superfamily
VIMSVPPYASHGYATIADLRHRLARAAPGALVGGDPAVAFGLATLLWHTLGYSGVEAQLPLYIFVFLVALGVDYNIFLIGRIREEAAQAGIRQGTLRGLSATGGVITAAGALLAGTFAALSRLPDVPVAQVGTAIAIGVLLDTLLVRTVLVPAGLLVLGERSWWPSKSAAGPQPAGHQPPTHEGPVPAEPSPSSARGE